MPTLRAHVHNGRIVLDEPTDLPEGTVLDLVVDDEGDDVDDAERAALDASIGLALEAVREGRVRAASEIVADLRARR